MNFVPRLLIFGAFVALANTQSISNSPFTGPQPQKEMWSNSEESERSVKDVKIGDFLDSESVK